MAQFRMKAVRAFRLDGQRYQAGDILGTDALHVVRDLVWRGLVVAAPLPVNGAGLPSSVGSTQH